MSSSFSAPTAALVWSLLCVACQGRPTDSASTPPVDPVDTGRHRDTGGVFSHAITAQAPGEQVYGFLADGRQFHVVQMAGSGGEARAMLVVSPGTHTASRMADGAPVAMLVVGSMAGTGPCDDDGPKTTFTAGLGIVAVMPLVTGICCEGVCSDGDHDMAGAASRQGLRDAWGFLRGNAETSLGWDLATLVGRPVVADAPILLISSASGHLALPALAEDPDTFSGLSAIALYETPTAPEMTTRALGTLFEDEDSHQDADGNGCTWDDRRNVRYAADACDQGLCALPLDTLRWDPDLCLARYWGGRMGPLYRSPGVFYLDGNGNDHLDLNPMGRDTDLDGDGALSLDEDFVFWGTFDTFHSTDRYYHPPALLQEALHSGLLSAESWPIHVPTLDETRVFWEEREVYGPMAQIVAAKPDLSWLLVASVEDHAIPHAGRPHITGAYEALQQAGARVIFEPSYSSLAIVSDGQPSAFDRLDWNAPLDRTNVVSHLVPAGYTADQLRGAALITLLDLGR